MQCQQCGWEDGKSIYWINKKGLCGDCAASIFHKKLFRLQKRFKKLNIKYKELTK